MDCEGYRHLLAAVEKDEARDAPNRFSHDYRGKLDWAVARAKHYAEKTGLTPEALLDAWEKNRTYWYMNYYQEAKIPTITTDTVRVFETVEELRASVGETGFRCPNCKAVSKDAYRCDSGVIVHGKPCDWKVYGLFGHMGQGISVFVKNQVALQSIFMPVAWEGVAS